MHSAHAACTSSAQGRRSHARPQPPHLVRHAVGEQHHVPRVNGHAVPRHGGLDLVHDLGPRRLDALQHTVAGFKETSAIGRDQASWTCGTMLMWQIGTQDQLPGVGRTRTSFVSVTWLVTVRRPSTPSMPITACGTERLGCWSPEHGYMHSRDWGQPELSCRHVCTSMCVLVLPDAWRLRSLCHGQAEPQLQDHTFRLVPSANKLPGPIRQLRVAQHCCHGIALLPRYC